MVNKSSAALQLSVGLATFFEYLPSVLGALASFAAIVWTCVQIYYFIKEKRNL